MITPYVDNKIVKVRNLDDLSFDFVSDDGSPNSTPSLVDDIVLEIYKISFDQMYDGTNVMRSFILANGLLKKVKVQLVHQTLGVIFDGWGDALGSEYTCDIVFLKINADSKSFIEQANALNLRKIYQNDALPSSQKVSPGDGINEVYYSVYSPKRIDAEELIIFGQTALILVSIIQVIKDVADAAGSVPPDPIQPVTTTAEILGLALAFVSAINRVGDTLLDRIRRYYCVNIKSMLEKSCAHIGFTLDTNLFDDPDYADAHLLSSTSVEGAKLLDTPENNPIPDISFGELIDTVEKLFKAKAKIKGGKLIIKHEEEFYQNPAPYVIKKPQSTTEEQRPRYSYNKNEILSSFKISFAVDSFEENTNSTVSGNKTVVTYEPTAGGQLSNLSSKLDINIPFARGYRIEEQTKLERAFNAILDAFNSFFFGSPNNYGDRIGMLKLDGHMVGTPKIFILNPERKRIRPISNEKINSFYIYENRYREFANPSGQYARWTIVNGTGPQVICRGVGGNQDVILAQVREDNVCKDFKGDTAILTDHVYSDQTNLHEFVYRTLGWYSILLDAIIPPPEIKESISEDE